MSKQIDYGKSYFNWERFCEIVCRIFLIDIVSVTECGLEATAIAVVGRIITEGGEAGRPTCVDVAGPVGAVQGTLIIVMPAGAIGKQRCACSVR